MTDQPLDVVGIGNAIVDVLAQADEAFLEAQDLAKGAMTLIDGTRAEALYAAMGPAIECSGGSAANTIAGMAELGSKTGFIGRVADDQHLDVSRRVVAERLALAGEDGTVAEQQVLAQHALATGPSAYEQNDLRVLKSDHWVVGSFDAG